MRFCEQVAEREAVFMHYKSLDLNNHSPVQNEIVGTRHPDMWLLYGPPAPAQVPAVLHTLRSAWLHRVCSLAGVLVVAHLHVDLCCSLSQAAEKTA